MLWAFFTVRANFECAFEGGKAEIIVVATAFRTFNFLFHFAPDRKFKRRDIVDF
ncbi:hypothetical protein CISEMA079M_21075 [Citrobacter sedlakii]